MIQIQRTSGSPVVKAFLLLCAALVALPQSTPAPSSIPPLTAEEHKFFHHLLMSTGGLDRHPSTVQASLDSFANQFGLNEQELNAVRSASQKMRSSLAKIQISANLLLAGRQQYQAADEAALRALSEKRHQSVEALAHQILLSMRPETINRIRSINDVLMKIKLRYK